MSSAAPSFAVLLAAALIAALVVGFLKTSLGGGIGLVLTPTLTLVLPAPTALALIAALLLLSDPIALRLYWRVWEPRQLRLLLPTSLVGVIAGTWVLSLLSAVALRRTIGAVALVFALAQLVLSRRGKNLFGESPHWTAGAVAGLLTGFASVIAHSGGLVTGLYLLSLGLPGAIVVGTGAAVYCMADVLKLAGYARIGFVDASVLLAAIASTPLLAVGAWLGFRANRRLPRRAFELALIVIAVTGSLRLLLSSQDQHGDRRSAPRRVPAPTVRHSPAVESPQEGAAMADIQYFGGLPEMGIVPRAPHAGPLLQHVYEQEHGRGGFSGKVTHTYHLYPPTNWVAGETKIVPGYAPRWESPLRPLGGVHHALGVAPPEATDVYRGMARLLANATCAMNVVAPRAPMDYFFEHHSASMVFFVHEGAGTLETTFGPIAYGKGDFLIIPKGVVHRFDPAPGPQYYWMYESFTADPEKSESPTTGRFLTHSESDYKFPRSLQTINESGRFDVVSKVDATYTRRVHPTHPFDVIGWRGDYLPYKFAVEDVRPMVADRSHVPPSGHTIFKMPGCYICIFTVRSVEKEGMWVPFFHRNLDYCETLGYHYGDFFSAGGVVQSGMVTVHPVGLPHGPKPKAMQAFMAGRRGEVHNELAVMADFANPTQISEFALGISRPDYMDAWSPYTTDPQFAYDPARLDDVRAIADRLSGARDTLRPPTE